MNKPMAIIPARASSKRVPGKNMRLFMGKPMLQMAIELAQSSTLFDMIVVSSEADNTLALAGSWGAKPFRDLSNANDNSDTEEVIGHILDAYPEYDYACCLYTQAGAFMTPEILRQAYNMIEERPVVSWGSGGKDAGQFYWLYTPRFIGLWEKGIELNEQDIIKWIINDALFQDINTEEDWQMAEEKYRRIHGV
ncbi:MAG: hypothetical protein WC455_13780 [Dehalococcoidia bacterium]|jgi:N-acylneuraminate cytidylyltransferase